MYSPYSSNQKQNTDVINAILQRQKENERKAKEKMTMENEKRLFTQNIDVSCHLASIRQACHVMLDYLNLANSSMFITLYIANGMDNCVKQMLDDVKSIQKQIDELNKEKE